MTNRPVRYLASALLAIAIIAPACAARLAPHGEIAQTDPNSEQLAAWMPVTPSGNPGAVGPVDPRGRGEDRGGGEWRRPDMPREVSDEEREQIFAFMKEHSPNRFEVLERLPDGHWRRHPMLMRMAARYRHLQRFREQDESVYKLLVRQFELQDEVFGLTRDGKFDDPEIISKLREKVGEMVQLSIQERQKRIEGLERALAQEKQRLEDDKANPEQAIDRQLLRMKNEAEDVRRRVQDRARRGGGAATTAPAPQRTGG
jgi:hypothetical protein